MPLGYWEAKDEEDDLDAGDRKKIPQGLPAGQHHLRGFYEAVLIQNKQQVMRCGVEEPAQTCKSCWSCSSATSARRLRTSARLEAVQDRSARRAESPARHDRTRGDREREIPQGVAALPQARPGHDQPERNRRRCARDADPAHPNGRNIFSGVRRLRTSIVRTTWRRNSMHWKTRSLSAR